MSRAVCPSCQTPVHPLLGEAPLVVGDRIVVYCSDACRHEGLATGRTSSEPGPEVVLSDTARVEAFSDAVLAIVITLLVLGASLLRHRSRPRDGLSRSDRR